MEDHSFFDALDPALAALGMSLDDTKRQMLLRYHQAILEANKRFNLTRITDPAQAAVRFYADALAPVAWLEDQGVTVSSVLDVGSGAGIPAAPIAICRPAWRVIAVDSTGKKAHFIEESARALDIQNLKGLHVRAGEWRPPHPFDVVLFKAVGPLARCLDYASGLPCQGGHVIIFKGASLTREELDEADPIAEQVGLQIVDAVDYTLPIGEDALQSTLVVYERIAGPTIAGPKRTERSRRPERGGRGPKRGGRGASGKGAAGRGSAGGNAGGRGGRAGDRNNGGRKTGPGKPRNSGRQGRPPRSPE